MKDINKHTIAGMIGGAIILLWGIAGGENLKIFWNFSSLIITIGGSFCALLVTFSFEDIKDSWEVFLKAIKDNSKDGKEVILKFAKLSRLARRRGLLSLEDDISQMEDEYLKKGLQMVIDGVEPENIQEILDLEIDEISRRNSNGANLFKVWGKYAQAFGMIGTVIGLIQMLANITDSSSMTLGMAKALIATFYGIILDYMLFSPISTNLMLKSDREICIRDMMLEGILAIQSGINHTIVEEKLITFLSPKEKYEYINFSFDMKKEGGVEDE